MSWSLALWLVSPALASAPAASASPEVRAAARTPSPEADAARLIEEATRAYKVRDFATTIDRLDRAYQLTGSTDLLYELGDAHARYYELDRNPDHLRQARSFFRAFARRSEAVGSAPRDAWERVSALSKRISTVEAAGPRVAPQPACPRCPPAPRCPGTSPVDDADDGDPEAEEAEEAAATRAQRRADASLGLMVGGGALAVPGIVLGALFLAEGRALSRQLDDSYALSERPNCGIGCDEVTAMIERDRERGLIANRIAATGVTLAIVGGAMAIAGATIAVRDRKGARRAEVRVVPSVGGLGLAGRF